jgi:hypothetical protein
VQKKMACIGIHYVVGKSVATASPANSKIGLYK